MNDVTYRPCYLRPHVRCGAGWEREIGDEIEIRQECAAIKFVVCCPQSHVEPAAPKEARTNVIPTDGDGLNPFHLTQQETYFRAQLAVSPNDSYFLTQRVRSRLR